MKRLMVGLGVLTVPALAAQGIHVAFGLEWPFPVFAILVGLLVLLLAHIIGDGVLDYWSGRK